MKLAPIVLFVYKRPEHLQQTLAALRQCPEIGCSPLYVFSDAAKKGCAPEEIMRVEEVKRIARGIDWCGELIFVERPENYGFQNHVRGITEVIEKHGRVIVLEDDLLVAPGFLTYMNKALDLYADDDDIMHVSGYMLPLNRNLPDTFFYNAASCWGWGTWKRAWNYFRDEPEVQLAAISKHPNFVDFDCPPYWYLNQMQANLNGCVYTWAVKWHASIFLRNGLCLHPGKSLVRNIGHDGTGENCVASRIYDTQVSNVPITVKRIEKRELPELRKDILKHYGIVRSSLLRNVRGGLTARIRVFFKKVAAKLIPSIASLSEYEKDISIHYGKVVNSRVDPLATLYPGCRMEDSCIGPYSYIAEDGVIKNTEIGKFVSIGPGFRCGFGLHPIDGISTSPAFYSVHKQCGTTFSKNNKFVERKRIYVGNDVYIGMNVTLLDGVTIGDGAVIGAGAVVVTDIPPYAVAVGIPAHVIKYRFDEDTVIQLLESRWWDGDQETFLEIERHIFDVKGFLETIRHPQDNGFGKTS